MKTLYNNFINNFLLPNRMVGRIRETFGEQEPRNLIESEIKNLNTETEKLLKKGKISELQAQKRKLGSEITEERVAAVKFTRKRKAKKNIARMQSMLDKINIKITSLEKEAYKVEKAKLNSEIGTYRAKITIAETAAKKQDLEELHKAITKREKEIDKEYAKIKEDFKTMAKQAHDLANKISVKETAPTTQKPKKTPALKVIITNPEEVAKQNAQKIEEGIQKAIKPLYVRLNKIKDEEKNPKERRKQLMAVRAEYRKKVMTEDGDIETEINKALASEVTDFMKESLRGGVDPIIDKIAKKIHSTVTGNTGKQAISKFLTDYPKQVSYTKDDYRIYRKALCAALFPNVKKVSSQRLYIRAVQKILNKYEYNKGLDGSIGVGTRAALVKLSGFTETTPSPKAPGQAPERPGQVAGDLYPDYASLYYVDQPGQTPVNATEAEKKDMAKKYKYNQKAHKKIIADYKKMGGTEKALEGITGYKKAKGTKGKILEEFPAYDPSTDLATLRRNASDAFWQIDFINKKAIGEQKAEFVKSIPKVSYSAPPKIETKSYIEAISAKYDEYYINISNLRVGRPAGYGDGVKDVLTNANIIPIRHNYNNVYKLAKNNLEEKKKETEDIIEAGGILGKKAEEEIKDHQQVVIKDIEKIKKAVDVAKNRSIANFKRFIATRDLPSGYNLDKKDKNYVVKANLKKEIPRTVKSDEILGTLANKNRKKVIRSNTEYHRLMNSSGFAAVAGKISPDKPKEIPKKMLKAVNAAILVRNVKKYEEDKKNGFLTA